jgi:bifunctional non-homologous end joining protein LigD
VSKHEAIELLSVDGHEVRVTHPHKSYFSKQAKLSKLDLVKYYQSVAKGTLAGIRDRPLILKRFVDGAEERGFLSKARAGRSAFLAANRDSFVPFRPHCGGGGDR